MQNRSLLTHLFFHKSTRPAQQPNIPVSFEAIKYLTYKETTSRATVRVGLLLNMLKSTVERPTLENSNALHKFILSNSLLEKEILSSSLSERAKEYLILQLSAVRDRNNLLQYINFLMRPEMMVSQTKPLQELVTRLMETIRNPSEENKIALYKFIKADPFLEFLVSSSNLHEHAKEYLSSELAKIRAWNMPNETLSSSNFRN